MGGGIPDGNCIKKIEKNAVETRQYKTVLQNIVYHYQPLQQSDLGREGSFGTTMTERPNDLDDDLVRNFACWIEVPDQLPEACLIELIGQCDNANKLVEGHVCQPILVGCSAHFIDSDRDLDGSLLCRYVRSCKRVSAAAHEMNFVAS